MKELKELALPAFAMLDGCHEHELDGRTVILHVRSASVIEILEQGKSLLDENVLTYRFSYENRLGIKEHFIAALHYCATLDVNADAELIRNKILKPAAKWYCEYATWEDENIAKEEE